MSVDICEENLMFSTPAGRVYVKAYGNVGCPVIFALHGWGVKTNSRRWRFIAPVVASCGYRVYCPDMPGFGKSPGKRHNCRSETNLEPQGPVAVVCSIMDQLGVESAGFMGFSWGGGIILSLALKYPKRVTRLLLFMASYTDSDQPARLRTIRKPTLALWFPVDQIHPISLGRYFAKTIPGCKLETIDIGFYCDEMATDMYAAYLDQVLQVVVPFIVTGMPSPRTAVMKANTPPQR